MLNELMSRTFNAEIAEGKHEAVLTEWRYMPHTTDPTKDYIKLTFNIQNAGTTQVFSRNMFERDMSIMLSHTRRQLGKGNEAIEPKKFLDELIQNKTKINLWFEYTVVTAAKGLKRVQNVLFSEPFTKPETVESEDPMAV